jgi:hypothetical protein
MGQHLIDGSNCHIPIRHVSRPSFCDGQHFLFDRNRSVADTKTNVRSSGLSRRLNDLLSADLLFGY